MTAVVLVIAGFWLAAIWALAKDKHPFETDEHWRRRRREELRRKITQ